MTETLIERRPHHVAPALESIRLILTARVFMQAPGSHIGLNITAGNNMKVLRRHGVHVETWPTQTVKDLWTRLAADKGRPITHVVISAPGWIHPDSVENLSKRWPETEFTILNHSGLAYLSIDRNGVRNNRALLDLALYCHNIRVAGNNPRLARWLSAAFGREALHLPNLYDTDSFVEPVALRKDHDPIRVGGFGAGRPWKNQLVAAEAAVELARRLKVGLELYVNSRRPDGGERIIESRDELFRALPGTKKFEIPWAAWPRFRHIIRTMDILFSPSFDETFCVVVADGIAEGIPSVVGPAMEWCPKSWQCDPHDPESLMRVAMGLLHDPQAVHDGRHALKCHVDAGIRLWLRYLTRQPQLQT